MALKDFLALADEKLHETFSKKAYDPTKDRAALIKRLDTADNQFKSATPTKGKKMFRLQNGVVELNLPIELGGKSRFLIPAERFSDAIEKLKSAVGAGEADTEFEASQSATTPKTPRKLREGGGEGRAWSDERRARFAETIAARKATKG